MLKMRKVRAETSLPDLLAWIFSNCGRNAMVVRTPATEPIRSFIVLWSDVVAVNRIRRIRYRSLRRRRAPDDAVCGRKPTSFRIGGERGWGERCGPPAAAPPRKPRAAHRARARRALESCAGRCQRHPGRARGSGRTAQARTP